MVGQDDVAVNIMGMLAYQTAHVGRPADAVEIAETAAYAVRRARPIVRARIAGRLATAHASDGDLNGFRTASEQARELLEQRRPEDDPPFLYYLNPNQLAAEAGQALVDLAERDTAHRRMLLGEAVSRLSPLTAAGPRAEYQRSALLHGCYLADAHLRNGDLEQATAAARTALARVPGVESKRCYTLLLRLRRKLASRRRNPWVSDLLPELDQVVGAARP